MKSICVFCGSQKSNSEKIISAAKELGKIFAKRNIQLVFGGSKVGIMGLVADSVLAHGGRVVGVIPEFLAAKEIVHEGLTELIVCQSMHERKLKMYERSEGFIALPGGYGTLEELSEILTWGQLGLHEKPIGVLNVEGFYNSLLSLFQEMKERQLLTSEHFKVPIFEEQALELLEKMKNYQAPPAPPWMKNTSET